MAPLTSRPMTDGFQLSRVLRAFVFAFVASTLIVSLVIVLFAFIWDNFVAEAFNRGPYETRAVFVVPTILLVTLILTKILWDVSSVRASQRVREPGTAEWSEPTSHARKEDRERFDPDTGEKEKRMKTGPTGPSGYGAPSGGWDKAKLP